MNLVELSGPVSHVKQRSEVEGEIHQGRGDIKTKYTTVFRVAGRPVEIYGAQHLENGDLVSVVGLQKGDAIQSVALRNDSTHITLVNQSSYLWPVLAIVMGVPLIPVFGAGLIFIGWGAWQCYKKFKEKQSIAEAVARLDKMPPAAEGDLKSIAPAGHALQSTDKDICAPHRGNCPRAHGSTGAAQSKRQHASRHRSPLSQRRLSMDGCNAPPRPGQYWP
jgi:hypothetical protein